MSYATYFGGSGNELVNGTIAIDSSGNAYITGGTSSFDLPQVNSLMGPGGLDRGLFRSVTGGNNWTLSRNGLRSGFVFSLAVDRTNSDRIYAGTQTGVSKSTDGGLNWADTGNSSPSSLALAIDPSNSSIVYSGTINGVYKTTTAGSVWIQSTNRVDVRALVIDPLTPATIYAGGLGPGSLKSTNAGGSWTAMNSGLTNLGVRAVAIDPLTPTTLYAGAGSRVFKSINGAATWAVASTGLPTATGSVFALTVDPQNPQIVYAGTNSGGIYKTTNGGGSWTVANNNLLVSYSDNVSRVASIGAIAISSTPATLYAASNSNSTPAGAFPLSTVFKSTDAGASWTATTNGFGSLNSSFFAIAVDPNNGANVYVGNNGDVDAFFVKINAAGSTFLNSTYLSSSRNDTAMGVAVDSANNPYILGHTQGANFPTTAGAFQTVLKGNSDAFVAKLNPSGTSILYSTYLGGSLTDTTLGGIAVDSAGDAYVTGLTSSTDFPVTPGAFQTVSGSRGTPNVTDAFITKLNPSATALSYSSYLGGSGFEPFDNSFGSRLALGADGSAYLVGDTSDPDTFPYFDSINGFGFTYVAKVDETSASYSITGRVTNSLNAPIAGVFVDAVNQQGSYVGSNKTDAQGYYSLISLPPGDYTVTPQRYSSTGSAHYIYAPPSRTFTGLSSDQTADFTATQTYDIQGSINHQTIPGLPIFDVTVTLSGAASATTVTDAFGNFFFRDLTTGNYTVTPTKAGFTFNPVNRVFNSLNTDQFTSFTTASGSYFTISGRAADSGNAAISNATVVLEVRPQIGSRYTAVQTNATGNYSFANLQAGGNYTVLAAKPLVSFAPSFQTFNNLSANQTLNFTGTAPTGLIGKIAFLRETVGQTDIASMNADGTSEILLASTLQCSSDSGPAWSPDGAKLAFSRCDNATGADLLLMNSDGTGLTTISNQEHSELYPGWSPDGTRLTYTFGECSGTDVLVPEIFAINATGTLRTNLTNSTVVDAASDWSPNGSTIVFARGLSASCSGTDVDTDLYVIDSVGGNQRRLTSTPGAEFFPAHSPDGTKIAYSHSVENFVTNVFTNSIFVMNADGTGQTKLTPDLITADRPTWSPDGTKLAFQGYLLGLNGATQIFAVNADGTGLVQITSSATIGRVFPSWQHYSISGRVTGNTTGVPITMTLAGTLTRVTRTDAAGNYVFGNLAPGGNYSVTPISNAFGFSPAKTDVNNLVGNQVANFTILPAVIPTPTPPLADDFTAVQRDPAKWNLGTQTQPLGAFDPQIPVVQQNGQLVVTPRSQTSGLHYNGYVAVNSFDFNNSKATVEVAQPATNGAETIFAIGSDLDNFSRFVVRAGPAGPVARKGRQPKDVEVRQLIFQVRVGGQLTSISIPYDSNAHRFMRFRHEPPTNSIVFETSPNNVDFTVRHTVVLQKSVSALTAELSAGTSTPTDPGQAIFDNFSLVTNTFQFSVTGYTVNESAGRAIVTVTRSGDLSTPASVDYSTFDDTARQKTRYIPAVGTLSFAPGQTTRTFSVLVEDNSLVEGSQSVSLRLLDSTGAGLNSPGRAVLTVDDNDSPPITTNPLDNAQFFVRQNYYDFLSRTPDQGGLDYWTSQITQCGSDQDCINLKRIDVSNAFYFELEFQQTGSYVYRLYRVAYGNNQPFPNPDSSIPGENKSC